MIVKKQSQTAIFNESFNDKGVSKTCIIKIVKEKTCLAHSMDALKEIKEKVYMENVVDIKRDNVMEYILDNNHG